LEVRYNLSQARCRSNEGDSPLSDIRASGIDLARNDGEVQKDVAVGDKRLRQGIHEICRHDASSGKNRMPRLRAAAASSREKVPRRRDVTPRWSCIAFRNSLESSHSTKSTFSRMPREGASNLRK
jgi:hypothetical protein